MAKKISEILNNIGNGVYDFLVNIGYLGRPIGIIGRNYEQIYRQLSRNIGNNYHEYDGYATPIGGMADPYFNLRTVPWFLKNINKNTYSNYLNYIRGVYSSDLSISPISNINPVSMKLSDNSVGAITDFNIELAANGVIQTNTINGFNDTYLGILNNHFLTETLLTASDENTIRDFGSKGITSIIPDYFGLNIKTESDIHAKFALSKSDGRVHDTELDIYSPVENSNYGNITSLGTYGDFFDVSSTKTQEFINHSLFGDGLIYGTLSPLAKKKYHISNGGINSHTYVQAMTTSVGIDTDLDNNQIRYVLDAGNTTIASRTLFEYFENDSRLSVKSASANGTFNSGINYGSYYEIDIDTQGIKDILDRTNRNFTEGKYRTLISRFYADELDDREVQPMQTAISKKYGLSKGRNLLKKEPTDENGYTNPYCRVWTYHHQYATVKDLIRPLSNSDGVVTQETLGTTYNWNQFRSSSKKLNTETGIYEDLFPNGGIRLDKMGVKNSVNGFVNITPSKGVTGIDVKNCMFSIENLAWKGMFDKDKGFENGLSEEQKGPFGGRIMWFPPYDISFNENVGVNWSSTAFIGRGENIYSYVNTERSGNLSFKILIDHPSILNYWTGKDKIDTDGGVDDIDSYEQEVLRFFAGCGILEANPVPEVKPEPIEPKPEPKPNIIPQEKRTYDKTFTFFVFYPNNYSGVDDKPNDLVSAMEYLINGVGTQMYKNNKGLYTSFPTTEVNYKHNGNIVGGYEIRLDKGISIVTAETATNRVIAKVTAGDATIDLTTQSNAKTKKEWYYRVDNRVSGEILQKGNYVDSDSFGLNSNVGYQDLLQVYGGKIKKESLYSFTDVFLSLDSNFKSTLDATLYNETKINELKEILSTYKIKEVNAMGIASSHGYKSSNNVLNKNRAQSVINWLKSIQVFKEQSDIEYKVKLTDIGNVGKTKSVSELLPKLYRAAQIEVVYRVEELVDVQATVKEEFTEKTNKTRANEDPLYKQVNFLSGNPFPDNSAKNQMLLDIINRNYNSKYGKKLPSDITQITEAKRNKDAKDLVKLNETILTATNDEQKVNHRYDNEKNFFSLLKEYDPLMHNKITDKIKYFDPAFHSITPEGFNSRLTFLHQCTRQGSTVGSSDINSTSRNANNLAFGRPPILILRIGDFYYTKIIVESMNITYDPLVWDLNSEGIGVQPMIAHIDLSFKFLGGSDLAGPIARLQNALSFNYYGNTGVYDNRSEMVEYTEDKDGTIKKFKAYK